MNIRGTMHSTRPQSNRVSDCIPADPECNAKAAVTLAGGPSLPTFSPRSEAPLPDCTLRRFNVPRNSASAEADGPILTVSSQSPTTDCRVPKRVPFHQSSLPAPPRKTSLGVVARPLSLFAARLASRVPC
jgi:hypothetical protein